MQKLQGLIKSGGSTRYTDKLLPGETYHIYNRAIGAELLFKEEKNYPYFLEKFLSYTSGICEVYCYCLLPNHFHFLARLNLTGLKDLSGLGLKDLSGLAQPFSNLFNCYAKSYNKMYHRKGTLFMRPFKRILVDSDAYFTQLIHYIHANPVHHGYVENMHDWKFSSYNAMLSEQPTRLLREDVIRWFGNKKEFIRVHQQPIEIRSEWEFG